MKRRIYLIATVLLFQLGLAAQSLKLKFTSINEVGIVVGKSRSAYQLQTINGLTYKTFSAGIGVGIDDYYLKTVPLFLDVRKNFGSKKLHPFLYGDAGTNFPWNKADVGNPFINGGEYSKGIYLDAGAGYSIKIKKIGAMFLSIGYTSKTINEESYYYYAIDPLPYPYTPETNKIDYKYTLSRVTIKMGLSF